MSWRGPLDLKNEQNAAARFARSLLRRMTVSLHKGRLWQVVGHIIGSETETSDCEPFQGIGFAARPDSSERAEAIVAQLGDSRHVVIVATRNEDARRIWDALILANTASMFNNLVIVRCTEDGTVEAHSEGGTAVPLATKADLDALRSAISGAVIVPNDGGAALKTAMLTWTPVGTSVLKGE